MTENQIFQPANRLTPRNSKGGRPRSEIAAQLGDHILDVALEQFAAHGFEQTSMDRIAAAANVSKRTLYARFGSKAQLLMGAFNHALAIRLEPIVASIPDGSVRDQLLHAARSLLDISLTPLAISVEGLLSWLKSNPVDGITISPDFGTADSIGTIISILEQARGAEKIDQEEMLFLAYFIFDALVTSPRNRITRSGRLENTERAKADFLERTIDLISPALPFPIT